ncbi:hypothetical protein [Tenacibaculum sp. C7A-26P2]|uniref:hypothetical protein n=1 Tax=Tenacibaculum sp. C7A-26P2 TaxID=3447504 RepID=UPI003F84A1B2
MKKSKCNIKVFKIKCIIQFIWMIFFFKNAFSQSKLSKFSSDHFYDNAVQKITSPDASAFHESKISSLNGASGRASINVPLYQINQGGVTIPIQLNYISSGVKVNSLASNVGLNWSLDAGGSITKVIKGFEDFSMVFADAFRDKFPDEPAITNECGDTQLCQFERKLKYDDFDRAKETLRGSTIKSIGWLVGGKDQSIQDFFGYEKNSKDTIVTKDLFKRLVTKQDPYPDLFLVNAPGLNTKFTHKKDKTPFEIDYQGNQIVTSIGKSNVIPFLDVFENTNMPAIIQKFHGSKPRAITCINNIEITSNNGIKYGFSVLDANQYVTRGASRQELSDGDAHVSSQEITTYHLSYIKDNNGDKIEFKYQAYQTAPRMYSKSQNYEITTNEKFYPLGLPNITEVFYPQLHRLTKIKFKNGVVDFIYSHKRKDVIGDRALTNVIVKNNSRRLIKKYTLNYDYFVANTNNCNKPECLRLKLKTVQEENIFGETLPPYQFFYDETRLPEFGATTVDYLGYANGIKDSYENDKHPSVYMEPPTLYFSYNKKRFSFSPFKIFDDSYKTKGRDISSNLKYTKAGTLVRIKKPTGANQYFTYELNTFSTPTVKNISAAGLRLKKQRIEDEKKHVKLLEEYFYEDEKGYSSGVINNLPLFGDIRVTHDFANNSRFDVQNGIKQGKLDIRVYSSSKNQVKLADGNNIIYSRVIVKNGINNGVTEKEFSTANEFPVEEPELQDYFGGEIFDKEIKRSFENGAHFSFLNNNDVKLGKLTKKTIRDAEGKIVKKETHNYTYQLFDAMNQTVEMSKSQIVPVSGPRDFKLKFFPKIFSHRNLKTVSESKTHYTDGVIDSKTEMVYDPLYPFVKKRKTQIAKEETLVVKNYYPNDVINSGSIGHELLSNEALNAINLLKQKRRLGTAVQTESYRDDHLLSTQRINFKNWGSGIIAPRNVKISKENNALETGVKQTFDTNGNLVEIAKNKGVPVCYIYGYNNSFPVAKVEGARLEDIPETYITEIKNASNRDYDRTLDTKNKQGVVTSYVGYEGQLRKALNKLYSLSSLAKAVITVYTYDPLIGITSTTDTRKRTTYYDYDTFNRLQYVKNQEGEVLTQYCYNYKGEKKECNKENNSSGNEVNSDPKNTTDEVSVSIGNLKEYMIPYPANRYAPKYFWKPEDMSSVLAFDIVKDQLISYNNLFYTPTMISRHEGDIIPGSIDDLNRNFYTLNDYFQKGYFQILRKGYSFALNNIENLKNIPDCYYVNEKIRKCNSLPNQNNSEENLKYNWYIISEGKRYSLAKTLVIKTVFFVPACLDNKLGKVVCEIYRDDISTSSPYQTIVSHEILFKSGFRKNDNNNWCRFNIPIEELQKNN